MAADLAALGFEVDTRPIAQATTDLDRLSAAAIRTEQAAAGVGRGFDKAGTSAANMQRSVNGINAMLEQTIRAHVQAEAAAGRWHRTLADGAKTTELAAYQVQNLRAQFIDIGTTLYGGMNPLTILMQQGPQIAQIFGPGAGVRGILGGVVTEVQRLVPLSLGIAGGVAGGLGVIGKAYLEFDASQKAVAVGLTGLGQQSGIAAGEIEKIGRASILATDSATRYATAFASTGNATRDTLTAALNSTRDFATTFGTSFDDAAKIQQEFFTNGSAAYDKYAGRLATYSATTSRLLQDLQKQGRGGEVVRMALDEINPRLAKYNELAGYGQRATNYLTDALSNFWSNVNRGAAVAVGDPRLNVTAQQSASAAVEGELARMRSDQERAATVVVAQSRANRLLEVNPVERQVKQSQVEAGLGQGDKYQSIDERFAGVFGTASRPDLGSYRQEARERPSTQYFNGLTLKDVAERAERSMIATPDELRAQVRRGVTQSNDITQARALNDVSEQSTRTQQAQAQALGKSAGEAERLTTRANLLNRATADGIPLSEANRQRIDAVSAAIGRQQQAYVEAAASREVFFQRAQLGRTPQEQIVSAQVRQIYGDNTDTPGAQALADQIRLNASIRDTQAAWSSLGQMGSGLIDPLLDSTRSWSSAVADLARNFGRAALQAALFGQGPFAALAGTQGAGAGPGGFLGMALGPIGAGGRIGGSGFLGFLGLGGDASNGLVTGDAADWFANGGVMTSRGALPLNRYANGGVANSPQMAIFGEGRGPEAYVPLPDGRSIPVSMKNGAANQNAAPTMTDARSYSFDLRGSTLTEAQVQSALARAIATNNQERDRTQFERGEAYRRMAG
ncbi:Phage-related minor tail protein [Methylobacterium sp. 174MFSha1.1]|uniref:phage tail length tape measure family protein n=1 Tax=Methylobacterium sp. 174MFSha1.1 TaxID=1502749 RepID=UPI0008F2814D|nr:phage tail length tape measure family protein [Methylobacterium sp. 174MFSha1.1]SFV14512.1 Phage-related minor tail protein [Methylobacterium sp. 174MFSha1.1]